jgi:DNA invertase Pin-like site-specific DNA recombinase
MDKMRSTSEYDGCGKCFVGVRRLSRVSGATNSPEKQGDQVEAAAEANGGHIIGWADDWEVSGATDPLTRPKLGPWLRDEMGPYSGIIGAAVDRVGRNVRDVLNTAYMIKSSGRLLITHGHDGPWDLDDSNDEVLFNMQALGSQLELRNIQRRNREETVRAREAGQPRQYPSYGYRFVRLTPTGKVDRVELDPVSSSTIREVAERILADETGKITPATECTRLNRAGVPSPNDHRAATYGREPKGNPWNPKTLIRILTSEAALGYLMHERRPVINGTGEKIRLAPELWDAATRDELIKKLAPKRTGEHFRAPKGTRLLSGIASCGKCGQRLYVHGSANGPIYVCIGRVSGIQASADCKPAPLMTVRLLDAVVAEEFLRGYGRIPLFRRVFDAGTGYAARIAELQTDLERMRGDRQAGLYKSAEDEAWYRSVYVSKSEELEALRKLPDRPAGMRWVMTGRTVADKWREAADDAARREILDQYEIKAVLYPSKTRNGQDRRVWVHGLDPDTATQARQESAELTEIEQDARLDLLQRDAEHSPDWQSAPGPDDLELTA